MNSVSVDVIGVADAFDVLDEWHERDAVCFPTNFRAQFVHSRHIAVASLNGYPVMMGGIVRHATHDEGWFMVRPHWLPPPRGFVRLVRAIRAHLASIPGIDGTLVFARSPAGRRLAINCGFEYLRIVRASEIVVEVFQYVMAVEGNGRDVRRAVQAQDRGRTG
jgi:hypothetical protein